MPGKDLQLKINLSEALIKDDERELDTSPPTSPVTDEEEQQQDSLQATSPAAAEKPKASFADRWLKPVVASYIFTTGANLAIPHLFSQTFGRIPVVGAWTANAMKTVFQKLPLPMLDALMTSGSLANFKNIKGFFVIEDASVISRNAKIGNAIVFWGSSFLVGYTARLAFTAAGHAPEEGIMIPLEAVLPPEAMGFMPPVLLPHLYLWNQNISALTIATQTIVTPVVESGIKKLAPVVGNGMKSLAQKAYANYHRFFAKDPAAEASIQTNDVSSSATILTLTVTPSASPCPTPKNSPV